MSNPYQAPLDAENNSNQLNSGHQYSAAEISQLYRCRMGAGLLLFVLCLVIIVFICGVIAGGLQLNTASFLKVIIGISILAAICSFIGNVMLLFSPERSGAKELFMFSFFLGIIAGVAPSILSFMDVPIATSLIANLILAILPLFCLILFLTAWCNLGLFINSYDVYRKMKRARTAFCCTLLLPLLGFILSKIPGLVGSVNPLGIILVGSVLLGAVISLIVFVINYGNGLTSFRKAVYEMMLKN